MKKRALSLLAIFIFLIATGIVLVVHDKPFHDSDYSKQWGLSNNGDGDSIEINNEQCAIDEFVKGIDIKYNDMWTELERSQPKREVVVAIIDTGIDFSGKDLDGVDWKNASEIPNNRIDDDNNGFVDDVGGWNFVSESNQVVDQDSIIENSHGTMVAGIISAKANGAGIEGITKGRGVKVMPLKVLSSDYDNFEGEADNVVAAIKYADMMGAQICNLSFSSDTYSRELYEAMSQSKMLFIVSAGNCYNFIRLNIDKKSVYPASFDLPNIITVANIGFDGKLYKDSNYGPSSVDLAAPGTNIYSTSVLGEYQYGTGTSFSTPFVTGVAAVLYRYHENPTPENIKSVMCNHVTKLENLKQRVRTGGMLNAKAAVQAIIGNQDN